VNLAQKKNVDWKSAKRFANLYWFQKQFREKKSFISIYLKFSWTVYHFLSDLINFKLPVDLSNFVWSETCCFSVLLHFYSSALHGRPIMTLVKA